MSKCMSSCFIQKTPYYASTQEILLAARKLNGAAFKLFMYLNISAETEFIYKRVDAAKILNINRITLDTAFEDLCNNNYLIETNQKQYNFFTNPAQSKIDYVPGDNIYTESMKEQ